ncbi:MAG: TonB-dependent receptor [Candidatus Binatia bacterium]
MTRVTKSMHRRIGLAIAVGMFVPPASWGQAVTGKKAAAGGIEIEEITVTAQKREENIQEVPISITALGGAALTEKGVTEIPNLGEAVPNLRIATNPGGNSGMTIGLRGLGTYGTISKQTPVGLYVDGIYISKIEGSNFDLEDLERVEVLRGPQGTLFGRNTIGGAINIITKKPTEERSITAQTEVGNYDTFNGRLTFNAPLIGKNGFAQSDALGTLSLRETVGYKTHDGYFRNALRTGEPSAPTPSGGGKLADLSRVYTLTALRWQPNKEITVDYSFEYHRWRQSVPAFQATYVYPGSPVSGLYGPAFDLRPYVQTNRVDSTPNNAVYGADFPRLHRLADDGNERMHILSAAWDLGALGPLGNVTVKSLSSYRSMVYNGAMDLDGGPQHLAENHPTHDVQHWSEELQWLGTAPRIHYVAGFYYYGEYAMQSNDFVAFGGAANVYYKNLQNLQSYAPYGQFTWTPPILSDKLSLTVGMRYTQEQVHLEHFNKDLANPASPANWSGAHGKAFGIHGSGAPGLSPMGDISYAWTDDAMTYFRISRGFKGGGFNDSAGDPVSFSIPFQPERLLQYEAGFKTQWFDKRLRLNAAGFYSDYNDLQVSAFRFSPGYGPVNSYTNAANAEIWGMEFEGTAIPLHGLEATVGYSFLATKYLKWLDQKFDANNLPVLDANGNPVFEDVKDQRSFAFSPKNQLTAALTYTAPPSQSGTFSAHLDVYWQDRVTFITNNDTAGAQADEGWAYALVNGRLQFAGIPLEKGSLDLALWGRNLFDRKYRTYGIDFGPGLGFSGNNYGDPRTFGVGLTYNFNAS